jgi:hypothetical protein
MVPSQPRQKKFTRSHLIGKSAGCGDIFLSSQQGKTFKIGGMWFASAWAKGEILSPK